MQPHFLEEETILFAPVNDALVQKALDDHIKIADFIKALDAPGNLSENNLLTLAGLVDSHVRYEERELFPHLESVLTQEQLQGIGEKLLLTHDPKIKEDFADEFWIKK